MNRVSTVKQAKVIAAVTSILLFLSGMFFIIIPSAPLEWMRWFFSGACILMGFASVFGYFSNDLYRLAFQNGFAAGTFCFILGILIFISPVNFESTLPYVVGIYVILDGMMKLQTAIDARTFGMHKWLILLITASVVGVLGIITVFFAADSAHIKLIAGIALAADGAENMWDTMYTVRVKTRKHKAEAAKILDGDFPKAD